MFLKALQEVLRHPSYAALSVAVFLAAMLLAIWLPNLSFVAHIITSSSLSLAEKAGIIGNSLGAIKTNFTTLSRVLTVTVAGLFAVQMSVVAFYLKRRIRLQSAAGVGGLGMLSGLLGIGCAACGSVILSSLFGMAATAGFIGVLPLKGQEFGILSILILGLSLFLTTKKIQNPLTCEPKSTRR